MTNVTDEATVRRELGAWNSGLTCSNGATPPNRVLTSAAGSNVYGNGYNCSAAQYGGMPVCFSW